VRQWRLSWQGTFALLLCALALFVSAGGPTAASAPTTPDPLSGTRWLVEGVIVLAAIASAVSQPAWSRAAILFAGAHGAAWLLLAAIAGAEGAARTSFFLYLAAAWLLAWGYVSALAAVRPASRGADSFLRLLIPAVFGAWILILWEGVTRGAGVPFILLPPPSAVGARIAASVPVLLADMRQTILKAVLAGYLLGCGAGFATAVLADRFGFLRRGLMPVGNMVSALPIIGVAPIMVIWFGFDWQSKAAVVVVMTFFPMLVNTVAGLASAGHMERDLMRTYASGYWQTLLKLRLPAAMPFVFNALKINSTLALIGAIVAEFFGTPVVGMGFRISTEVGRMNIDMVWAEIAVAALCGSVFYGALALLERAVTFWHPSVRGA
jgi:NitT/TauT family transport system permease protein